MRLSFLTSKETHTQDLYHKALAGIQEGTLQHSELGDILDHCCHTLTNLPAIVGAFIAVTDGHHDEILMHAAHDLDIQNSEEHFDSLRELRKLTDQLRESSWQPAQAEGVEALHTYAHPLLHQSRFFGTLFVRTKTTIKKASVTFAALDQILPHLGNQIANAFLLRENRLIQALQKLATTHLTPKSPETRAIVDALQEVFEATSVTLLVKEHDKLYLSATTDHEFHSAKIQYTPGQGFTGYILQTGNTIHLFDATDPAEIQGKTGIVDRKQRSEAEKVALSGRPFHLLAVPTYSSDPSNPPSDKGFSGPTAHLNGVLRITRTLRPFAEFEKLALQHLGIILGTALAHGWEIYLGVRLWQAGTEAVAISRYKPRKGPAQKGVPILVDFDDAAQRLFGGSAEELRGIDVRRLYPKKDYDRLVAGLTKTIEKHEHVFGPIAITIRRLDGSLCSADASYRLLTSPFVSPETHYTVSLLRDTTEREKILAQHFRLVELLAERQLAYFAADEHGKTRETSPAEMKMTKYSKDELLNMQRKELYAVEAKRTKLIELVRREDGRLVNTVQELKRKDGTFFKANGFLRLLKDKTGHPIGYEGLYEDGTDKINLQELLDLPTDRVIEDLELYERLKEDTKMNLDYMTSLSHQIRTPLGALIQNLFDFETSLPEGDPFQKQINYLMGQTKICNMLAENLSYIDRILKGEQFKEERINFAELAIQTKLNFKHILKARKLRLLVDNSSISEIFSDFSGSPELFRQVFVNLIDNAIKYSGDGTVINITAIRGIHENILRISNIGLPVHHDQLKKIFERGFRNIKAIALGDGTGIGLWIVKKIIHLHRGGSISCTSTSTRKHHPMELVTFRISFKETAMRGA